MKFALNKIIQGDALEKLKKFPDESVNCVVTSPPYWALRDYGTARWEGGNKNCDHLVCKLSSDKSTLHRNPEKKKMGTGMPYKEVCRKCGAKRIDQQIGLELTFQEYIQKLCNIFDETKRVLKKTGTCWVNLGDTYNNSNWAGRSDKFEGQPICKKHQTFGRGGQFNYPDKCLCQIPFRFAIEMVNRGWILRNTIIWWKPSCMPSSVKDRFTVDFEYLFFFVKNRKYWFEKQYEPLKESSLSRAKYSSYSLKTDKGIHGGMNLKNQLKVFEKIKNGELQGRNKRCVWRISTSPFRGAHFAVFPEGLVETPIKAGCPKNGLVLDPFIGSGTTAVVSKRLGRNYIGIELNPEYIEMAERRIKAVSIIRRSENERTFKSRETGI